MKFFLLLLLSTQLWGADFRKDEIERLQWGNYPVTWLRDERLPIASVSIYFAEGALRDKPEDAGKTQAAFDLLFSGTSTYGQKDLSEFFDFYAVDLSHNVTHEYAVLTLTSRASDLPQVIERFCHVVKEANFPEQELVAHKERALSKLKNLSTNHSALAERAFRSLVMKGSQYQNAVEGNLLSLERLETATLKQRWKELRDHTSKRFYVKGARDILKIKQSFLNKCGWGVRQDQAVKIAEPVQQMSQKIYLVVVPGANQAQIRIGRYLSKPEAVDPDEKLSFASDFLGGGFTSDLIQEVRVKRGLTYSIGSYVSLQAQYGRVGISTFSKNQTVMETLEVIRSVLEKNSNPQTIDAQSLEHVRNYVLGHYPFGFEGTSSFLSKLTLLDHVGLSLETLYQYPDKIKKIQPVDVSHAIKQLFAWEQQVIVVVGDKSLAPSLAKLRPLEIIELKDLL